MSRRWVADASPLILLGKIGRAALLSRLSDELAIPEAVAREVTQRPEGERVIGELTNFPGVQIVSQILVASQIAVWDLGPGESQVLAHASAVPNSRAVLDDLEARRCAQSLGLPVIGTLGVVLRARRRGLIEAARPVIDELRQAGLYASDQLIEQALAHLGEEASP